MPQVQLPIFPAGTTSITPEVAFEERDGTVVYFNGHLPVFTHQASDLASFRLFTTQLIVNGTASQRQVADAFGVPLVTVKRCCKRYREGGPSAFFVPAKRREGTRLTPDVLGRAQSLLDEGGPVPKVASTLGVLVSTVHKAISAGRLRRRESTTQPARQAASVDRDEATEDETRGDETRETIGEDAQEGSEPRDPTSKSERSVVDSQAPMGVATGRTLERVAAAVGQLDGAPFEFESADDVPLGGVLCALPALLALGLLRRTRETFSLPKGFYPIETVFLVMAFLALARIRSLEAIRYQAPGEWGKLIGLDRIPEVKTLREKLSLLCDEAGRVQRWSGELAKDWMKATPDAAGTLYVDGHVRVYHGRLTKLPRRYVARQKLCLRGTTDYWVNAMDGQPFFVVTKPIDEGLIAVLRDEIVPRLLKDVPNQPSEEVLKSYPLRHRFTLVFDRAGYSPAFFQEMRDARVAVTTYNRGTGVDWPVEEFSTSEVVLINGEQVRLNLAERGTRLTNGLWVREVRELDSRGHQVSVLSTDYGSPVGRLAAAMFARWCQENFFKYMLDQYGLDRLVEHALDPLPETARVVNPAWRTLDSRVKSEVVKLSREQAEFGAFHLQPTPSPEQVAAFEQQKGNVLQTIQKRQASVAALKADRKKTPKHILVKDLPEEDRFSQLRTDKKHLVDTIKMIAYRAETVLVGIVREKLSRSQEEARAWVRGLFESSVDLRPNLTEATLTVAVHRQATAAQDAALLHVCTELNETETIYPGTTMRLVFVPVGAANVQAHPST